MKLHTSKPWFLLSAILLLAALSFTSCSKEDEVMNLDNIGSQLPGNMIKYVDWYQEAYEYDKEDEEICFGGARIKSNIYDKEKGYGIITFWDDVKEVSEFRGEPVSIVLPEGVVSIGDQAFNCYHYVSRLSSIILPKSLRDIGNGAFFYSNALTNITIPNSVESIGEAAFAGCSSLESIVVAEGNSSYDSRDNCNAIIEKSSNTLVAGCRNTSIPSSVEHLGNYAFYGTGIKSIVLPDSLISIGERAFFDCDNLKSITMGKGMPPKCDYSFELSTYTDATLFVPAGFKETYQQTKPWGEFVNIVEGNTNSITGECGDSVIWHFNYDTGHLVVEGKGALEANSFSPSGDFGWSYDIKTVEIKDGVTSIGDSAFYYCSGITSVTIPNGMKFIRTSAFMYCFNLTSITIPSSVEHIGSIAFFQCENLTSITIPSSVTYIGWGVFTACWNLKRITVDKENTVYDSRDNCNAIINTRYNELVIGCETTVIPSSVTSIDWVAFRYCNLTSITIPSSVTSIGRRAFEHCSNLTSITIPSSVTSIGYLAFSGCSNLTSIEMESPTPPSVRDLGLSDKTEVIVPAGSLDAYKSADGWKDIVNIVERIMAS